MTTIRDRAIRIIAEHLPCEPEDVVDSATFQSLGADSLDTIEITFAFEEEFKIEINDTEVTEVSTVGDAIKGLERRLAGVGLKVVGGRAA